MNAPRLILILLVVLLLIPYEGSAHQIKSDHGATVMLHVDPSDEPFSGTTTQMYLVFTNEPNNVNPEECNCVAYVAPYSKINTIKKEGTKYDFSQSERVLGSYSISHVFPKHDIYAVVLEGTPKEGATFEAFRVEYSLRVARGEELSLEKESPDTKKFMMQLSISVGVFVTFLVLVFLAWKGLQRRNRKV